MSMIQRRLVPLVLAVTMVAAACGGDTSTNEAEPTPPDSGVAESSADDPAEVAVTAPDVTITGPIPGEAEGSPTTGFDEAGYGAFEYFVAGSARSFDPVGELSDDGIWELDERDTAPFTTRIVVKRPLDPADFSGTVLVEWNNVTAGFESTPGFTFASDEILRSGHVHVAVSAQRAGIEDEGGGLLGSFGAPLKTANPERYADLVHPGDDFSYDLFAQIGALVQAVPEGQPDPLDGLEADQAIALGESQSAFRMTSFVNGVHPISPVFDGFFVHSRSGGHTEFREAPSDGTVDLLQGGTRIRDDLDVPVLVLATETDLTVLGYAPARQPDSDLFRSWEVAGTAHADSFLLGGDPQLAADALGCAAPVNDGPQHLAVKAAIAQLNEWVVDPSDAPPTGERIEVVDGEIVRDADGNALGGIRLAPTRVPVAALSGDPVGDSAICSLFGSTALFSTADLVDRYGDEATYRAEFGAALDEDSEAGFILADDVPTALAEIDGFTFG